jgi:nucleoid-associated protein YgaU
VTVRPGDSLWSLAANRLGGTPSAARIQAEWPRWYAANRQVIGADPNLLRPGASLLVPDPARTDAGT